MPVTKSLNQNHISKFNVHVLDKIEFDTSKYVNNLDQTLAKIYTHEEPKKSGFLKSLASLSTSRKKLSAISALESQIELFKANIILKQHKKSNTLLSNKFSLKESPNGVPIAKSNITFQFPIQTNDLSSPKIHSRYINLHSIEKNDSKETLISPVKSHSSHKIFVKDLIDSFQVNENKEISHFSEKSELFRKDRIFIKPLNLSSIITPKEKINSISGIAELEKRIENHIMPKSQKTATLSESITTNMKENPSNITKINESKFVF